MSFSASMQKTFPYYNTLISYTKIGMGLPVVLLHGFGEDSTIWNTQVNFLKDHCQLIVPDLPGSGKSQMVNEEWSIEDFADCIFSLLTYENITQCILLGHSMGGYITLDFAERYPTMLKAFGLLHSTAFADSEEKKQTRLRGMEMMEQYGAYHFLKSTTPNLFGLYFKTTYPEKIEALIEQGNQFSKETLQQFYKAMMQRPDRTHVLRNCTLPVLFIMGEEDIAAPVKDVLQQVYLPEIAYIHILENVGHMGMQENEKQFTEYMLRFIQEAGNEFYQ